MKTNYFILLILLFSFSFANAQTTLVTLEEDATELISKTDYSKETVKDSITSETENEVLVIDVEKVKELARSSSDIKIYFNRLRNVDNLNLLFPKINKEKTV